MCRCYKHEPPRSDNSEDTGLASVSLARIGRKVLVELVRDALEFLGIRRRVALGCDVRPLLGVFGIHLQPLLETGLGIRLDRVDRAFRLAHPAVDALVW